MQVETEWESDDVFDISSMEAEGGIASRQSIDIGHRKKRENVEVNNSPGYASDGKTDTFRSRNDALNDDGGSAVATMNKSGVFHRSGGFDWFIVYALPIALFAGFNHFFGIYSGSAAGPAMILMFASRMLANMEFRRMEFKDWSSRFPSIGLLISAEAKFALFFVAIIFFTGREPGHALLGLFFLVNGVMQLLLWVLRRRLESSAWYHKPRITARQSRKTAVIVGTSLQARKAADFFLDRPDFDVDIIGFIDFHRTGLWRYRDIPLLGSADDIAGLIKRHCIDTIIMAPESSDFAHAQAVFEDAELTGLTILAFPPQYQPKLSRGKGLVLDGLPVLLYDSHPGKPFQLFLKEIIDKIGAMLGLIVTSPVLFAAAVAIKIDSDGPIFFRQKRCGKNGKSFGMIKLRTMVNGADGHKNSLKHLNEMSGPVFKIKNDPRVTRVGRILRKYSIDELPQFVNVLKGEMSLVGPRPPLPEEVAAYAPYQLRRLAIKPGATCLWQISGRNRIDFEKWIRLDLKYIDTWSLANDARIILKTLPAIIRGNGAS